MITDETCNIYLYYLEDAKEAGKFENILRLYKIVGKAKLYHKPHYDQYGNSGGSIVIGSNVPSSHAAISAKVTSKGSVGPYQISA